MAGDLVSCVPFCRFFPIYMPYSTFCLYADNHIANISETCYHLATIILACSYVSCMSPCPVAKIGLTEDESSAFHLEIVSCSLHNFLPLFPVAAGVNFEIWCKDTTNFWYLQIIFDIFNIFALFLAFLSYKYSKIAPNHPPIRIHIGHKKAPPIGWCFLIVPVGVRRVLGGRWSRL